MAHLLAKLRGVKAEDIKKILQADAMDHAEQGLYLEHLWENAEDPQEVFFIFRVNDIRQAKQFVEKMHSQARKENPNANLPEMTYLEEK